MIARIAIAVGVLAACGEHAPPPEPPRVANTAPRDGFALAIVFNGQELWVGNDEVETDPNAASPGALRELERGLDALKLPPDTDVMAVAYATGARVVVPWTPAERMHGTMLGTQRDYYQKLGSDFVQGVQVALDALEQSPKAHKALLVIGDGVDTNPPAAQAALASAARRAADAHIAIRAIIWKGPASGDVEVYHLITPDPNQVSALQGLPSAIAQAVAELQR